MPKGTTLIVTSKKNIKMDIKNPFVQLLLTSPPITPSNHNFSHHQIPLLSKSIKFWQVLMANHDQIVVEDIGMGSSDDEYDPGNEEYREDVYDTVCSLCEDGGDLISCEGGCMRSFHATEEHGADSGCVSLGFTWNELQPMDHYKCPNCEYNVHQCFSCGQLASSDQQLGAQVFQCGNATCGYFYHPQCVANGLHPQSEADAAELNERIRAGELFTCPLHLCIVCRQPEDKTNRDLQMAQCRRCPKAYHRRCLPGGIAFGDDAAAVDDFQRAWDDMWIEY